MTPVASSRIQPIRASYARAAKVLATPLFGTGPRGRTRPALWDQRRSSRQYPATAYVGYSTVQNRYITTAWQREQTAGRVVARRRREYEAALAQGDESLAASLAVACFTAYEDWAKAETALRTVIAAAGRPALRTPEKVLVKPPETPGMKALRFLCLSCVTLYVGFQILFVIVFIGFCSII